MPTATEEGKPQRKAENLQRKGTNCFKNKKTEMKKKGKEKDCAPLTVATGASKRKQAEKEKGRETSSLKRYDAKGAERGKRRGGERIVFSFADLARRRKRKREFANP